MSCPAPFAAAMCADILISGLHLLAGEFAKLVIVTEAWDGDLASLDYIGPITSAHGGVVAACTCEISLRDGPRHSQQYCNS